MYRIEVIVTDVDADEAVLRLSAIADHEDVVSPNSVTPNPQLVVDFLRAALK
jgi:hypothetical protein